MKSHYNVLVIGAGTVGITVTGQLKKKGIASIGI